MDAPTTRLTRTVNLLVPFALAMVAANVAVQVTIALADDEIGVLAGVLTAVIALGYAAFLLRRGGDLGKVRFGTLAAHVVTYAAVNTGFGLHFLILTMVNSPAIRADSNSSDDLFMDPGWFGVVLAMPALWGLGLLIHAVGAIAGRGFEAGR